MVKTKKAIQYHIDNPTHMGPDNHRFNKSKKKNLIYIYIHMSILNNMHYERALKSVNL